MSEPLAYYGNQDTGVKCLCCKGVTKLVRERLADFSIFQHTMGTRCSWSLGNILPLSDATTFRTANSFLAVDGVQVFFKDGNRLCVQRNNAVAACRFRALDFRLL